MYTIEITNEETYALAEAKRIINEEQSRKREMYINKVKQKILGIIAIGISIAELILANLSIIDEGGVFIFMLPLGIYALFTKENILG